MTHFSEDLCVRVYVCLCVFVCAGMHTYLLLLCVYCMCGCIGLVSQLPSFAALVKRGATLMRRGTDSVSAAPDRVCGPLRMKRVQSAWCASVKRGNPWSLQCLVHCTHIRICSRVSSHSSHFHCFNILQAFISGMYNTIKNAVGETAPFTVSGVPCSTLAPPPPHDAGVYCELRWFSCCG